MFRRIFFIVALCALLLTPALATAADFFPLVPCGSEGQPDCTPCYLFQALKNFIDLILYGITGPIAVFMIVIAGGMILLYGANTNMQIRGRTLLTNTLKGVTIILLSWLAVTFLIKTLYTTGGEGDAWYQFSCPAFLQEAGAQEPLPPAQPSTGSPQQPVPELQQAATLACSAQTLAASYGVPGAHKDSSALTTLMSCIERDPIVKFVIDSNQRYTYERSNDLCNFTRGRNVCGSCQHCSASGCFGSCHYGGRSGSDGAEAVDYNLNMKFAKTPLVYIKTSRIVVPNIEDVQCGKGGVNCRTVGNERDLFDEIYRSIDKNGCDYKLLNFEVNHTHVSAPACDMDGKGVSGRGIPAIP